MNCQNILQHLIIFCLGRYGVGIAVNVLSVLYSHCPYAVVASRSMAIVVDP